MISFKREDNKLILQYNADQRPTKWVYQVFDKGEDISLSKTFCLSEKDLL